MNMVVSHDRWRAGVKFLLGLGTNPALTADDQRRLQPYVREDMTAEGARYILATIFGWSVV